MAFEIITINQTGTYVVDDNDYVTLLQDVFLSASAAGFNGDTGADSNLSGVDLNILGTVVTSYVGVDFFNGPFSVSNTTVVIGATGAIYAGNDGVAFSDGDNNTVINLGTITFGDFGIYFNRGVGNLFENHGTVQAVKSANNAPNTAVYLGSLGSATFVNTGLISGATSSGLVTTLGANTTVFNSGQLIATNDYAFRSQGIGIDMFTNTGSIHGDMLLDGGNDTFSNLGGTLDGTVFGGLGDDTFIIDDALVSLIEFADEGTDLVQSTASVALGENFENLTLLGSKNIRGIGNGEANILTGNSGDNRLNGKGDMDTLNGGDGDDRLNGGKGEDRLSGQSGDDYLRGGVGDDILRGGDGSDVLVGGVGKDVLWGGADSDTFRFTKAIQSQNSSQADRIADFEQGEDVIDLSALLQGKLTYIDTGAFSGSGQGEVRVTQSSGDGFVRVDIDGDGTADMKIKVSNFVDFAEFDFLL